MRKIIALSLATAMGLSLVACGGSAASSAPASSAPEAVSSEAASAESTEEEVWLPYDENFEKKKTDRDATGKTGAVASSSWYASKAGLDILKEGGNAFDAAAAVAYTLGVVEPYFSGLGGGGFMTLYNAETGKVEVVDFREIAPAAANPQMWLDKDGKMMQYNVNGQDMGTMSSIGGLSVGVPGEVAGFEYILETYGSDAVTREQIFQPAIDRANNGYIVGVTFKEELDSEYAGLAADPVMSELYLNDMGLPYEVGDTLTNPDLAKTLELIRDGGAEAFYTGDMAQAMVDAVAAAGGNMTMEDLANYKIEVREPVTNTYRDYTIYSLPPASSGGTHLIEILNILENYDDMGEIGVNSTEYVHRFSEAFKIAFVDRAKYMADTAFADVPLDELTSKEYAASRFAQISDDKSGSYTAVEPEELEHYATTSFSIIDQWGNMVACTKTINYGFGSKVGVPGYGFVMNDEMDDFSSNPESVNCAVGGKRPLSSMSPSIVLYPDGSPYMTIGTPGATRIFPTIAQVIERMIDYDMDIQDAIDCARIYDNASENICYESGGVNPVSPEVVAELEAMGHKTEDKGEWKLFFGGVHGIEILEDGTLRAGADPRRDGKALAY